MLDARCLMLDEIFAGIGFKVGASIEAQAYVFSLATAKAALSDALFRCFVNLF